jgi:hypothetical protein
VRCLVAGGLLAVAACGGATGSIERELGAASTTTTPSVTTSVPATSGLATTTAVPTSTAPPVTSAPDTTSAPEIMAPTPTDVVRPAPAWIGFGIPQPGSMFENLREDHSLDGKGAFVALTFDDGPSQYTPRIVDILRFFGVPATFFQISSQTAKQPDLARLMLAGGHHIGAHTVHHERLTDVSSDEQNEEVAGSIDQINGLLGPGTVKCFRPPYAQYDQT